MKAMVAFILLVISLSVWSVHAKEPADMPSDIKCLQKLALSGDRQAARRLAIIYGKIDLKVSKYWYMIGAENGDPASQYSYAILLMDEGSDVSKRRAVFWLRRAAEAGDKDASAKLARMPGFLLGSP